MYNIIYRINCVCHIFVWAIVKHVKLSRQGEKPDDDPQRKPFLDRNGNHSYYDRKIIQK